MEGGQIHRVLSGLDPAGPPRMAFVRKAPHGITGEGGNLLCLSASFNPITLAHLRLLEAAGAGRPPDEALLLLSIANVDKGISGFPLEQRLRLLLAVAETRPRLSVALVSHGRFVDKAVAIQAHYPPGTGLHFLLGFDTLVRLFDPKYYADRETALAALFERSQFVAANRAPARPETVAAFLARPEVAPCAHRIRVVAVPPDVAAISATEVRARLARGQSVAGLVPPEAMPLLERWKAEKSG